MYKLIIKKRNYSQWTWVREDTGEAIPDNQIALFPFPIPKQLFHGDQYSSLIGEVIASSPIRTEKAIPGILVLEGNRTYGRQQLTKTTTESSSLYKQAKGRLYYRCIPYNPKYPEFLIPYTIPLDFSKHTTNLFVLFQYKEWKEKTAPYGILIESIGAVNDLSSYYRYLLVSKQLEYHPNHWIPNSLRIMMPDETIKHKREMGKPEGKSSGKGLGKGEVEKGEEYIFSIDPEESRDLDDAFSFQCRVSENGIKEAVVRIYISDVVYWMDYLGTWEALRLEKVGCSTIYLPDQNHPLLPRWISDKGGSLLEGKKRPVVALELIYQGWEKGAMELVSQRFFRDWVTISKNFRYDTLELEGCKEYQELLNFTCKSMKQDIKDSHDLVEYWMIEYNIITGGTLAVFGKGIFRRTVDIKLGEKGEEKGEKGEEKGEEKGRKGVIGKSTEKFLKHYKNTRGEYVLFTSNMTVSESEIETETKHTSIREGCSVYYSHASSPLRRIVDIYNQLGLVLFLSCFYGKEKSSGEKGGEKGGEKEEIEETKEGIEESRKEFRKHIENSVEKINEQNRIIRRVQNECEMLADFFSHDVNNLLSSEMYDGMVVDWDSRKGELNRGEEEEVIGYWVFLEEWERLVYVERQESERMREIGETGKYQIFLFEEEEKTYKKIVVRHVLEFQCEERTID